MPGALGCPHVHTPFSQSRETAWRIVLNSGVWLEGRDPLYEILHKSDVGCICTCARAHSRTMVPHARLFVDDHGVLLAFTFEMIPLRQFGRY